MPLTDMTFTTAAGLPSCSVLHMARTLSPLRSPYCLIFTLGTYASISLHSQLRTLRKPYPSGLISRKPSRIWSGSPPRLSSCKPAACLYSCLLPPSLPNLLPRGLGCSDAFAGSAACGGSSVGFLGLPRRGASGGSISPEEIFNIRSISSALFFFVGEEMPTSLAMSRIAKMLMDSSISLV